MSLEPFRIFIGYSQQPSESVAAFLWEWIKDFFPKEAVYTFMDKKSIHGGENSFNQIRDFLKTANAGVFCFAPNNLSNVWLREECSAIAANENNKDEDNLNVPFLINLKRGSPKLVESEAHRGLLKSQQQIEWDNRDHILLMLRGFNKRMRHGKFEEDALEERFNEEYPKLETEVQAIKNNYPAHNNQGNNTRKMIVPTKWEDRILERIYKRGSVNDYLAEMSYIYSLPFPSNEIFLALELLNCRGLIQKNKCVSGYSLTQRGIAMMKDRKQLAADQNYDDEDCTDE